MINQTERIEDEFAAVPKDEREEKPYAKGRWNSRRAERF